MIIQVGARSTNARCVVKKIALFVFHVYRAWKKKQNKKEMFWKKNGNLVFSHSLPDGMVLDVKATKNTARHFRAA